MFKKLVLSASTFAGIAGAFMVHAQAVPAGAITVPSSTATDLLASIGNIITDPGVMGVIVVAIALPLTFWFIHAIIGLVPKSRGRK